MKMLGNKEIKKTKWEKAPKTAIWVLCASLGHRPLLIGGSAEYIDLYCSDCKRVWRAEGLAQAKWMHASEWPTALPSVNVVK